MSSLDKISSHPAKDTLQIRDSDHLLQLEYSVVHHCSFCCPSVTAVTPPWPLFTSLIHTHSPSTDSFHSVTSKTGGTALNTSCFPFSCSYHSTGLVIACCHMSRVCELSVPHKIKFSLHFCPPVRTQNAVQVVFQRLGSSCPLDQSEEKMSPLQQRRFYNSRVLNKWKQPVSFQLLWKQGTQR